MTTRTNRPYTEADVEALINLRREGLTERQIAEALGRPYHSVHWKIKTLRKDGRLSPIRDFSTLSPDDVAEMAARHHTTVEVVEGVIAQVGKPYVSRMPQIEEALLQWQVQGSRCAYYGVPISLEASKTLPTRAVLVVGPQGKPMWASLMAHKMRNKLSHEMFLKSVAAIYRHVFTTP